MNAWSGTTQTRLTNSSILLIGPDSRIQKTLIQELQSLSAKTITADNLREASQAYRGSERPPSIVLLPEKRIDTAEFEEQLGALRIRTGAPNLVPIAYGKTPTPERRRELGNAGINLALFGRFGRHALRFQVNRALSPWATRRPRGELRAPQEWRTRTFSSGKEKAVRCYSLSSGGGYFVTPRPWVVGSDVSLELPVGRSERLLIEGRILYTNFVGDERALPRGMAVSFRPLRDHIQQVIRADISATQAQLEV
jgi:Tfp pilus assembly protein PilZ